MNFRFLFPALVLACALHAGFKSNVEYGVAGGQSLRLDACVPDSGAGPYPAVILVHGGGWMTGDKAREVDPLFKPFTRAGLAWFSVNYRFAPQYRYPACVEDVETAVRWVKAHAAEYNVDPRRLALLGDSAGGHIVDMVAVRATPETRVAGVASFYGPCDLVAEAQRRGGLSKSMVALFGRKNFDAAAEAELHDASPINYVSPNLPPFLLVHGTADKSVPMAQSIAWKARLDALGVSCELITIEGGPHVMGHWEKIDPSYKEKTVAWMLRTLHAPPAGGK